MPGYIPTVMHKLQHKASVSSQEAPNTCNKPIYRKHIQLSTQQSSAPKINSADTNIVQSINVTFLYYTHSVDPTILQNLNEGSTCKYSLKQDTMENCNQLL